MVSPGPVRNTDNKLAPTKPKNEMNWDARLEECPL
jgi:hypothetical protein